MIIRPNQMPTHHLDTLTRATPKGRRRIRRVLSLPKTEPVTLEHMLDALIAAKSREQRKVA